MCRNAQEGLRSKVRMFIVDNILFLYINLICFCKCLSEGPSKISNAEGQPSVNI